ncbi:MAG: CHAT domain-containing protein, partial [Hyphomicrobiaceae bacterium]
FPEYAALTQPRPLSLASTQQLLGPDEALYFIAPTRGGSFVWLVTRTDVTWRKIDISARDLEREVAALRCGLDATQWVGESALNCIDLTKTGLAPGNALLPFDLERAYKLYALLFEPFQDQMAGRELMVVSSGALSKLPFQALVTRPPSITGYNATAYQAASWLALKQAITVLPAVGSLEALRRTLRKSSPATSFLGVANPLLDGDPATRSSDAERARRAQQALNCSTAGNSKVHASQRTVRLTKLHAGRSGIADVALLRAQSPLPETADEVCQVGGLFDRTHSKILLGRDATEREIGRLNRRDELSRYGIVHFATHGALAGELAPGMEPGLILTPPKNATSEDDGYLSVSEIAELKLNADWVILSACNTAGEEEGSREALSGLARAFFYAGARSLLVSHWAVDSDATVKLITGAFEFARGSRRISKAEAMRQSMVALMKGGQPHLAHPAYWAPFVLAGAR